MAEGELGRSSMTLGEVNAMFVGAQRAPRLAATKQAKDYAKQFAKVRNVETLNELRRNKRAQWNMNGWEWALLLNLLPTEVAEAKVLIPSLKRLSDSELDPILEELQIFAREGGGHSTMSFV
eukprot:TRINITY_DN27938_c0_g1_i2.p1 TRINITY_DN27938_c0_g1~~TRINITY_DN27938_c0_g1_i2.p1  ORF type:complete len:130 (+),score=16.29 TRINITY_DN27938_c0_g1_i2:25-390(+)